MIIVQLSDIHVGSQFQETIFEKVISEVNALKPDAVIVTGDLTNEGLPKEYQKAKKLLSRLSTKKLIAISGNHDYRNTGYLLFKKHFPFETVNELDNDVVVVTIGTARPDRDEGEVGYRQNLWLERTMKKYENKVKILAMHHHLVGVPDTGSARVEVIDAGDVLRTILSTRVNLVICGHKHRPWIWNFKGLSIVNAGTASSERLRGFFENSYNIITIKNKKIHVDLKIVGGKKIPLQSIVEHYSRSTEE
jgi:3',5'-cyclic AMP phosphodiesterase CpdA